MILLFKDCLTIRPNLYGRIDWSGKLLAELVGRLGQAFSIDSAIILGRIIHGDGWYRTYVRGHMYML